MIDPLAEKFVWSPDWWAGSYAGGRCSVRLHEIRNWKTNRTTNWTIRVSGNDDTLMRRDYPVEHLADALRMFTAISDTISMEELTELGFVFD